MPSVKELPIRIMEVRICDGIYCTQHFISNSNDAPLREREMEVMKMVAKGYSNKQIAVALNIAERTVQTHLVNVFHKLRVSSRTEALVAMFRNFYLTIEDMEDIQDGK